MCMTPCVHADLLPKQGRESKLRCLVLWWVSHDCTRAHPYQPTLACLAPAQLHTSAKAAFAEKSAQLWVIEVPSTWHSIKTGWGQPLQAFVEVTDWKHCLGWQDHLRIPLAHAKQSLQPLLLQCCSFLGWNCHWWEQEKSTPRGNRTSSDMTPRTSVLAPWNCNKLVIATEGRSSPSWHQSDNY